MGGWVNFKPMPVGTVIPLTPPPYTLVCLAEIGIIGISRLSHLKIIFICQQLVKCSEKSRTLRRQVSVVKRLAAFARRFLQTRFQSRSDPLGEQDKERSQHHSVSPYSVIFHVVTYLIGPQVAFYIV